MKTIFATGPGFFAARSNKTDSSIPEGAIDITCARLEQYRLQGQSLDTVRFQLLPAMAEGNPTIARHLLELCDVLTRNREELERQAKGKE